MREIKFRAWDKLNKQMFYSNDNLTDFFYQGFIEDENSVVMQYTGLEDNDGVEIYEGDILKIDYNYEVVNPPELFECDAFIVYGYSFCSNYFIDNYEKVGLDRFYKYKPVIVGNVYENPELEKYWNNKEEDDL